MALQVVTGLSCVFPIQVSESSISYYDRVGLESKNQALSALLLTGQPYKHLAATNSQFFSCYTSLPSIFKLNVACFMRKNTEIKKI